MLTRASLLDAAAFWETGRLGYNGVLALAVFAVAMGTDGWLEIGREWLAIVFLGVIANVLYCGAYVLEVAAQVLPVGDIWRPVRVVVWCGGTAFATLIAVAFLAGIAGNGLF